MVVIYVNNNVRIFRKIYDNFSKVTCGRNFISKIITRINYKLLWAIQLIPQNQHCQKMKTIIILFYEFLGTECSQP